MVDPILGPHYHLFAQGWVLRLGVIFCLLFLGLCVCVGCICGDILRGRIHPRKILCIKSMI